MRDQEYLTLADGIVDFNRTYRKRKSKRRRQDSDDDDDTLGSSDNMKVSYNPPTTPHAPIIASLPKTTNQNNSSLTQVEVKN